METLLQDLRYTFRTLLRSAGFTLVTVFTLALGIGATTVMFSLVNAILWRPLPVAAPAQLISVHEERSGLVITEMGATALSYERYLAYRDASRPVLAGLVAQRLGTFSLREGDEARIASSGVVTENYFDVLGIRPALGRLFSPDEDASGAPVAVVSYALWQRELGGQPDVIGRTLQLDSRSYTLVGVAPRGFAGTFQGIVQDVWVPVSAWRRLQARDGDVWLVPFGRLKQGVTPEQAQTVLEVIAKRIPAEEPNTTIRGVRVSSLSVIPPWARGQVIGFLGMLLATGALVLLIASTNVAGMLLARATSRRRETAIRLAVGAGRARLIRQLLTESLVLFLLGGAAGVLLTFWAADLVAAFRPPASVKILLDVTPDLRVLGFALLLSLATGVIFGLAPALQALRPDVVPALKAGDGGRSGGRTRLRSGFVVAQLAMTLLLLVTAGLFIRTLRSALATDLGFEPDGVVVAGIDLRSHGYDEARAGDFFGQLTMRLHAAPGIESATLARFAPMSGNAMSMQVEALDPAAGARDAAVGTHFNFVDIGYFETLRIPILAGRDFSRGDRDGAPPVAVVNRSLASLLWPGESPIGRRIRFNGVVREVVGVARDSKSGSFREGPLSYLYVPFAQSNAQSMTVHARTRGEPGPALSALRREVRALDPNIALEEASPLPGVVGRLLFPQRMAAALIGGFGLLALGLAAVGLYGVLAYEVASRTREIGIRIALGAHAADVLQLVARHGLRLTGIGVALGLVAAFGLTRLMGSFLYGITATDTVTFVVVPLLLGAVALLASYLPARRATRVDAMVALRAE